MSSASDSQAMKSKVQVPAILLIVVGVINALIALYWIGNGALTLASGGAATAEFKKEFNKGLNQNPNMNAEERKQAEQIGKMVENFVGVGGAVGIGLGLVAMLCSAGIIFGGVKMMSLQSYGLAMTGTVLAMIPCLSPCCLLGLVPGIWGLVVLMNADVKASFR